MRRHLPEKTADLGESDLRAKIKGWQQQAKSYGVLTQRAVTKWSFLAMVLGDNFAEIPAIQSYLRQDAPPPSAKVDGLMKALQIKLRESELNRGKP